MARMLSICSALASLWACCFMFTTIGFVDKGHPYGNLGNVMPINPCVPPPEFAEIGDSYREISMLIFAMELLLLLAVTGLQASAMGDDDNSLTCGPSVVASISHTLVFTFLTLNTIAMFCSLQAFTYTVQLQHRRRLRCLPNHRIYTAIIITSHIINPTATLGMIAAILYRRGYWRRASPSTAAYASASPTAATVDEEAPSGDVQHQQQPADGGASHLGAESEADATAAPEEIPMLTNHLVSEGRAEE